MTAEDNLRYPTNPAKECDFVMKGGITSGVVYPPSILELQQEFRFRNVGGTSAGAIAAALTAAAELGRATGGFKRLRERSAELGDGENLLNLFAPQDLTRPLLKTAIDVFMKGDTPPEGAKESLWAKVRRYLGRARAAFALYLPDAVDQGRRYGGAVGLLAGLVVLLPAALWLSLRGLNGASWERLAEAAGVTAVLGGIGGGLLGELVAPLVSLARITLSLPGKGYFGLSVGYEGEERKEVLTTWLADAIDYVAGRDIQAAPLSFADLKANRAVGEDSGKDVSISLRMVTSNLSHREPYLLPFDERGIFLFHEDDMRRFFPERVVTYLIQEAPAPNRIILPPGCHFLPKGDKLPVIVATRLSLSFPFLLCAIPLYTIRSTAFQEKNQADKEGRPFQFEMSKHFQKNWFSDGGISSNFPIHFFDAWSPRRPTFGVNLMAIQPDAKEKGPDSAAPSGDDTNAGTDAHGDKVHAFEEIYLPRANETGWPQWNPVEGLPAFVGAIFSTAQNFRDNMQTRLPSYRERIVQIWLEPHEGGLNLAMSKETIQGIEDKGRQAGEKLSQFDFQQHRWVRFLVLMAELEKGLFQLDEALTPADVEQLFKSAVECKWYRQNKWSPSQHAEAVSRLEKLSALVSAWNGKKLFSEHPPLPESVLRIAPPI